MRAGQLLVAVSTLATSITFGLHARAVDDDLPTGSDPPRVVPIGVADAYYAYHDTAPAGRAATLTTTAVRHGEFAINLVSIGARLEHAKILGTVALQAGTSVDALYSSPGSGSFSNPEVWKHIQVASVGYRISDFTLEAGAMPSQIGRESFVSTENWNYTRAMIADTRPYFVAGLRGTYRLTPSITLAATVFNGWETYRDINKYKSGSLRIAFKPSDALAIENSMVAGPEQESGRDGIRLFDDLWILWKPLTRLQVAAEGWFGREQGFKRFAADGSVLKTSPMYWGAAAAVRFSISDTTYVAGRGEMLVDRSGVLTAAYGVRPSGTALDTNVGQTLMGGTLTLGWQPHPSFVARIEGVHRMSDEPFFAGGTVESTSTPAGTSDAKKRSTTFVASMAFSY